jgi:type IV secretory pathway VirJ component
VDYPATAFPLQPIAYKTNEQFYNDSVVEGVNDLTDKMLEYWQTCGSAAHVVLVGYSQGADVVGRTVEGLST